MCYWATFILHKPTSVHLRKYFSLAVLFKDVFIPRDEIYSGTNCSQAEQKQRSPEGVQACADVSPTHHQCQPPTPQPGGAALPPTPGLVRPGRTWNISQASIPIIHRQRLLVTQRIWGWLVCAAPRQLRSSRQHTSAGEQARGSWAKSQNPGRSFKDFPEETSVHPHK